VLIRGVILLSFKHATSPCVGDIFYQVLKSFISYGAFRVWPLYGQLALIDLWPLGLEMATWVMRVMVKAHTKFEHFTRLAIIIVVVLILNVFWRNWTVFCSHVTVITHIHTGLQTKLLALNTSIFSSVLHACESYGYPVLPDNFKRNILTLKRKYYGNRLVSEGNERRTLHKSAAKKKSTPQRDAMEVATITTHIRNMWQLKDQIVGFWYCEWQ